MSNPFKEIESQHIKSFYSGPREKRVRSGLGSTLGTVRFLGKIADIYLTRMVDTMVGLAGGSARDDDDSNNPPRGGLPPNLPPSSPGPPPKGPQGGGEAVR